MRTFSIRMLMALIFVLAISVTMLRYANSVWAGVMTVAVVTIVGISILGAVLSTRRERAWWLGFALFSSAYLGVHIGSTGGALLARDLLVFLHPVVTSPGSAPPVYPIFWSQRARALAEVARWEAAGQGPGDREFDTAMNMVANLNTQLAGTPNQDDFLRVGHCLFALMAGLIGGTTALWFDYRRERAEAKAKSQSLAGSL